MTETDRRDWLDIFLLGGEVAVCLQADKEQTVFTFSSCEDPAAIKDVF